MIKDKSKELLDKSPVSLVLLAAFMFYAFYSVSAGSPIFASDEYVYLISGKYVEHLPELYGLDAGLQRLSNLFFFQEIHLFYSLFKGNFVELFRLVHSAEYVLAGALFYAAVRRAVPKHHSLMGLVVFLSLPSHIFIYAIMPEVELVLLSAAIAFVLVTLYVRQPILSATIVGILVSVAFLIKPHAIATFVAVLVLLPSFNIIVMKKAWFKTSLLVTGCFLLAAYVGVIGLWSLMDGKFTLNPSGALGLTFYGKYIDSAVVNVGIVEKLIQVARYLVANSAVEMLLFLPVFVWAACLVLDGLKARLSFGEGDEKLSLRLLILILFAILSLGAHLLMTAWFTAGAASLNGGEAQRVHGRYLGPALAVFPFLFFYALSQLSDAARRALALLMLAALAVSYWFVSLNFKIYPWDNPVLFSFFNESNWYGWNYGQLGLNIGNALYAIVFLGAVFSLLCHKLRAVISAITLCVIMAVGCFQNYLWLHVHLKNNNELSTAGRNLAGLVGDVVSGDGILIGHERYGRESYLLFNLASAPKVLDRPEGSVITPNDIAGHSFLITDGSYETNALALPSVRVGTLNYYALKPSSAITIALPKARLDPADKPLLRASTRLEVSLANLPTGANLIGFNQAEPWGAWTSQHTAVIELPVRLKGRIRLGLFAWTLPQNLSGAISLQVGDQTMQLPIGTTGADAELEFEVSTEADRIGISSSVYIPPDSIRALGVAVARMTIEGIAN